MDNDRASQCGGNTDNDVALRSGGSDYDRSWHDRLRKLELDDGAMHDWRELRDDGVVNSLMELDNGRGLDDNGRRLDDDGRRLDDDRRRSDDDGKMLGLINDSKSSSSHRLHVL